MKIIFAHSAGEQDGVGKGSYDLVQYLKNKLSDNFDIDYTLIKDPEHPTFEMWKQLFDSKIAKVKEPIILIGHSLGGSMILKYLAEIQPEIDIAGLYLVSTPVWRKNYWDIDEFTLPENFVSGVKNIDKIYLYHSEDDSIVPKEHFEFYKNAFRNAKTRLLSGNDHVFSNGLEELVKDIQSNHNTN